MFTLNYTSFLKRKTQTLMNVFLRSVDTVCYDVDLIVFSLDFQRFSLACREVITE